MNGSFKTRPRGSRIKCRVALTGLPVAFKKISERIFQFLPDCFSSRAALFPLGAGASIVAKDVSHQHLTHLFGENLSIHPGTLPPKRRMTRLEHEDRLSLGFCATLQHFPHPLAQVASVRACMSYLTELFIQLSKYVTIICRGLG